MVVQWWFTMVENWTKNTLNKSKLLNVQVVVIKTLLPQFKKQRHCPMFFGPFSGSEEIQFRVPCLLFQRPFFPLWFSKVSRTLRHTQTKEESPYESPRTLRWRGLNLFYAGFEILKMASFEVPGYLGLVRYFALPFCFQPWHLGASMGASLKHRDSWRTDALSLPILEKKLAIHAVTKSTVGPQQPTFLEGFYR